MLPQCPPSAPQSKYKQRSCRGGCPPPTLRQHPEPRVDQHPHAPAGGAPHVQLGHQLSTRGHLDGIEGGIQGPRRAGPHIPVDLIIDILEKKRGRGLID